MRLPATCGYWVRIRLRCLDVTTATSNKASSNRDEARFSALAQPAIRTLRNYDPGHDLVALRRQASPDQLLELGSNENPYGPSPRVRDAALAGIDATHRYPDPRGGDLKQALAAKLDMDATQIILGNGSHELLMQLSQVFAGPDAGVVASEFGFAVFAIAAQAAGATLHVAPALPSDDAMSRGHDLDAILSAITPETRLVYVANPNNPTGTWYPADAFRSFIERVPDDVIVVVDEAYAELADAPDFASALSLLEQFDNLVVTRTFSKAYALAGLRIGYAVACPGLVAVLERVRESFNVNGVALAAAEAALSDDDYLRRTAACNASQRELLATVLRQRGWAVSPSQTNFLLVDFGDRTQAVEQALLAHRIVLRPMTGYGLPGCLRITVGSEAENLRLFEAMGTIAPGDTQ